MDRNGSEEAADNGRRVAGKERRSYRKRREGT